MNAVEIKSLADQLYRLAARSIRTGAYVKSPGEKLTYDGFKASLPYGLVKSTAPEDLETIASDVYRRMVRNGVAAAFNRA